MSNVRVAAVGVSIDGYAAGPDQNLEHPLGAGGESLFDWFFATRTWRAIHGGDGAGETGIDDTFARRGFENVGAWIIGRNMFGPVRGPWPDETWRGWWGEEPPYRVPVVVLTHYPRAPLVMTGRTTFHFVTGVEAALALASEAAGAADVRIGGGAATIRSFLQAGLIDEMHLALVPALLGRGEPIFAGLDLPALGYAVKEIVSGERATHVVVARGKVP